MNQSDKTHELLTGLTPGTSYSARVCAVRICGDAAEPIIGAYSPGSTFKTHKIQPVATEPKSVDVPPRQSVVKVALQKAVKTLRPEKENQIVIAMMLLFFLASILLAGLAHYWMV